MKVLRSYLKIPSLISYSLHDPWVKVSLVVASISLTCIAGLVAYLFYSSKTQNQGMGQPGPRTSEDLLTSRINRSLTLVKNDQQAIGKEGRYEALTSSSSTSDTLAMSDQQALSSSFSPMTIYVRGHLKDSAFAFLTIDAPDLTVWEFTQLAYEKLTGKRDPFLCLNAQLIGEGQLLSSTALLTQRIVDTVQELPQPRCLSLLISPQSATSLSDCYQRLEKRREKILDLQDNRDWGDTPEEQLRAFQAHVHAVCCDETRDLQHLILLQEVLSEMLNDSAQDSWESKYFYLLLEEAKDAVDRKDVSTTSE